MPSNALKCACMARRVKIGHIGGTNNLGIRLNFSVFQTKSTHPWVCAASIRSSNYITDTFVAPAFFASSLAE